MEGLLQSVLQCQALPKDVRIAFLTDCCSVKIQSLKILVFQEHFKQLVNLFEKYFNSVSLKFQQALCQFQYKIGQMKVILKVRLSYLD
jgi:hypothetical protein